MERLGVILYDGLLKDGYYILIEYPPDLILNLLQSTLFIKQIMYLRLSKSCLLSPYKYMLISINR